MPRLLLCIMAILLTSAGAFGEPEPSALPALPEAVSSFGAAACEGYLYVYGGHKGRTHQYSIATVSGKFQRLSLTNPEKGWQELPGGVGVQGLALVAHGGKLYRIGGMQPRSDNVETPDNISVASCAVFDPKAGVWEELPDLPAGRSSHDAVVVGDQIIVVGGWQLGGKGAKPIWHDTTLVLDLSKPSPRWESVAQPFRRRALNVGSLDGKVYAVCGMTPDNELEKTVDVFDPQTRRWTTGPVLPGMLRNGFTPAVATCGGQLYVSPADGKIYRLNKQRDGWDEVGSVQKPRTVHRLVALGDNRLIVLGGASRAGNVAETEVIEPACCPTPTKAAAIDPSRQCYCPVMTSTLVDGESREVEYQGVKVKLCCSACARKWNADPEAYLNPEVLPQLKGKTLPTRSIAQVYCPVYRDRVVSAKDPSVEYKGQTIYFFNETAMQRFLSDPEQYAKSEWLPQLKAAK